MTTSSSRNVKPFQRVESTIAVWISRVFFGQEIWLARFVVVVFFFVFLGMTPPRKAAR